MRYSFLVVLDLTKVAFIVSAIGSNIVWILALYSELKVIDWNINRGLRLREILLNFLSLRLPIS